MPSRESDITINSIGRRGDGVGEHDGRPVFVPRALPGEKLRVKLLEERDKGIAARLLEVTVPSPERITPPCPHYDECGGCALQHWDMTPYRAWKTDRVRLLLERAELRPEHWLEPVFIPHGTRRRTTLAAFLQNKNLRLGYHRARSHDITDIPACMVLSPRLDAIRNRLRPHLINILTDSRPADVFVQDTGLAIDIMITGAVGVRKIPDLAVREAMAALMQDANVARLSWRARDRDEPEIMIQAAPVLKKCGDLLVELPPGGFLQPSAKGEAALLAAVAAPLKKSKKIADLFAGIGTFAGPLHATAYESDAASVAAFKKAGGTAYKRNLFSDPLGAKELKAFDAVIVDPPRMGAAEQAAQLAKSDIPLIASISCNPSTFVRDAKILCDGGYRLESLQIIDQFVWSSHIELVGVFIRA